MISLNFPVLISVYFCKLRLEFIFLTKFVNFDGFDRGLFLVLLSFLFFFFFFCFLLLYIWSFTLVLSDFTYKIIFIDKNEE